MDLRIAQVAHSLRLTGPASQCMSEEGDLRLFESNRLSSDRDAMCNPEESFDAF